MAYIDREYYYSQFMGEEIPYDQFDRLVQIASDVIDSLISAPFEKSGDIPEAIKKATAYEAEMLYMHGGIDAAIGYADGVGVSSESLGDYSVSMDGGSQSKIHTKGGIPVSSLSISILRKAGLMCRWAYSEGYKFLGEL